jgi:phytanoyl-CoA hydroxylase
MDADLGEGIVQTFHERGYVVVEGLLDPKRDIDPIVDEYSALVSRITGVPSANRQSRAREDDQPVVGTLLHVMRDAGDDLFQQLDISLPLNRIDSDTPMHHGAAVFDLLTHPQLLDVVELFVGPEIYSNPVQHVRIKPPEHSLSGGLRDHVLTSSTFWHQDQAVITEEADASNVLSVWIPVLETDEENGCLVVVPGSHKESLVHHCRSSRTNGIPVDSVGAHRVPIPMKPGDVLFLHKLTKHASTPNVSDRLRWSFDLRYNPVGEPTGRPWFPGFVARSRSRPERELHDPEVWAESWRTARETLAQGEIPQFNRWDPNDPLCA